MYANGSVSLITVYMCAILYCAIGKKETQRFMKPADPCSTVIINTLGCFWWLVGILGAGTFGPENTWPYQAGGDLLPLEKPKNHKFTR